MIQLNVNVPLVNGESSLQRLIENIQLLTVEETSIHSIQHNMESLEEQVAGIAIRVSKCEDQVIRLSRYVPCILTETVLILHLKSPHQKYGNAVLILLKINFKN